MKDTLETKSGLFRITKISTGALESAVTFARVLEDGSDDAHEDIWVPHTLGADAAEIAQDIETAVIEAAV